MKNKLTTIIMSIIICVILGIFIFFGTVLWKEFEQLQTDVEPEEMKTVFSEDVSITQEVKTPNIVNNVNPLEKISGDDSKTIIDNNSVIIDKYFYNQLEEYSKTIYKAFEKNKENMKTGTYKIEFGDSFSSFLGSENGQDVLGKYYQTAIEAYMYDNPDVFYLNPNKMYINIETTTKGAQKTYSVYMDSGNETSYFVDAFSSTTQINEAISEIEKIRNNIIQNKTGDVYADVKMVHDYLVDNIEYDRTISKSNIYNVYGALVNREAVCEGYAKAFKYVMDGLKIQSTLAIGKGTNSEGNIENHAWNYVQVSGGWYAIDVTWDDPISTTGRVSQESRYKYFLKGSNEFFKDHIPSGQFTEGGKVFTYPNISNNSFEK